MGDPDWWLARFPGKHMSRTPVINGSANFRYRVMVIARFLSEAAKRKPFQVYK
jgi:hypothetical protein